MGKKSKKVWALFSGTVKPVQNGVSIVTTPPVFVKNALIAWSEDKDRIVDFKDCYPEPKDKNIQMMVFRTTLSELLKYTADIYPVAKAPSILNDRELVYIGYGICAPAKYAAVYIDNFTTSRQKYDDCLKLIKDLAVSDECSDKEIKNLKKAFDVIAKYRNINIESYPSNEACEEYLKDHNTFLNKIQ